MSYDLYLAPVPADGDFESALELHLDAADGQATTPRDPAMEAWKADVVGTLRALDATLKPFEVDFTEVAKHLECSEAEARERWRHIELNPEDEKRGIQLTVYDGHVVINVAYWHRGDAIRSAFERISTFARELKAARALVLYDPQLGRVIDLEEPKDLRDTLAAYEGVMGQTPDLPATPRKPWWKFWLSNRDDG